MKKILLVILVLSFATVAGIILGTILSRSRESKPAALQEAEAVGLQGKKFVWGATIRPYILDNKTSSFTPSQLDQQFKMVRDLFPINGCVRANIEEDMKINDMLVEDKEKYHLQLYLILEEIKDFNPDINYEQKADQLAQKIVARYKGKVDYYQLSNELSGIMFSKPDEAGEKMDAGYGLSIDKNRYEHVRRYATELSHEVRRLDPNAKIIITGHWVLIKPILQLLKDGVDADIIGWNWGSGLSDEPAIKNVDDYGKVDIPKMAKAAGKQFMLIEVNRDDGSMGGKESDQAAYIKKLSKGSYEDSDVSGYFHFILTDGTTNEALSNLGLVKVTKDEKGGYKFGELKPSYNILKAFAANHY